MLTDVQVRKAKAAQEPYKLTDGGGLYLFVRSTGTKSWRYRYAISGKEKLLTIGVYPAVSLADARNARDEARGHVKAGRDPMEIRRHKKQTVARLNMETVEAIGREWYAFQAPTWSAEHAGFVAASLKNDVFPNIGEKPIRQLTAPDVLALVRGIETRGAPEIARRVRQRISAICCYAIATGRAELDPAAPIRDIMAPTVKGRQPAIIDLGQAREILARTEATPAHPITKLAMRLLALTAVRPGTLTATPWHEFPIGADMWQIPAARMKLSRQLKGDERRDHFVPLSRQAVEVIEAARALSGGSLYVFPNGRSAHKPMSENAIGYLLNRAGYHSRHVPHGWRSTFSSIMNERYPADRAIIDLMLAHLPKEQVEAAYNRAAHLRRRRELAQLWADLLMEGCHPAASLLTGRRRGSDEIVHLID